MLFWSFLEYLSRFDDSMSIFFFYHFGSFVGMLVILEVFFGHLVFLGHFGHFRAFRCILEGPMIF